MDDEQIIPSEETPKKRGRKPKAETAVSAEAAPKRRPGRPKKAKEEAPAASLASAEANALEATAANPVGGDIIERARAVKRKYGKNVRRDDGPAWREAQADKEAKGEENDVDEDEAGFFEHQGGDEFAYTPASDDSESSDESLGSMNDDDSGDAIPEFFSTSDDDLRHDSYSARDEDPEETSRPAETEARENSDNRQNQNNWNRNNQQNQNNRNQNNRGSQNNNRNNNQNNRGGQNNRQNQNNNRNQQNQNNRNQNNRGNQNQNRSNQQNNQNNRNQQNSQNRQNQNNSQQNRQKKPKWMQNQNAESDAMNPADLPEWAALKSRPALDAFLAEAFFGKAPPPVAEPEKTAILNDEASELVEPAKTEASAAPVCENIEDTAACEIPAQESAPETAAAQEAAPKAAEEKDPREELDEIMRSKKADEMSYWEIMSTANDSKIIEHAPAPEKKAEEKPAEAPAAKTEEPAEAAAPELSKEKPEYNPPAALDLPGLGEIGSLGDFDEIYPLHIRQIQEKFDEQGIPYRRGMGKSDLVADYFKYAAANKKLVRVSGVLDVFDDGFGGAITYAADNYRLARMSVYVPQMFIDKYALKRGHSVTALAMAPREGAKETCPIAVEITGAMEMPPAEVRNMVPFTDLVPYYPTRRIIMEAAADSGWDNLSMRTVDLLTPVGFGQRALIVAPPRTGKTVLMQGMAKSIRRNAPDAHLIILLVDERPEEVTDFRRSVDAEVIASTFDEDASSHVHAAEMVISRARRMVEDGKDVVILLDSITRLARAYNAMMPGGGRTMSGGVEANALQKPKQFFGSARNIEGGGSLTIIGTALVETGSKMDEVIFEEFKGTGNLELHLDRSLSDKRIFPSINIEKSGTRKEELLYHPEELTKIYALRRAMKGISAAESMEMLVQRLKKVKTNVEFLLGLNR